MLKDRVQESTTTTGTGSLTVAAVTGYSTFNTAFSTGATNLFFYVISHDADWETGVGYLSAATTLVRNTVLASSNANALVSFTAGTKYVFNTAPADRFTNWRGQNLQQSAMQNYTEVINAIGTGSGARALDLSLGNVITATKNGATTWSITNVPSVASRAVSFTLILTNGGTTTGANTWPASVKWSYAIVPTLTNGGVDILTFMTVDNGTTWHGMLASADSR